MSIIPTPPRNVRLVSKTNTEVTLAWDRPLVVVSPARYRVRYRQGSSVSWIMHSAITTALTMRVDGLAPSTNYTFEVLANNGN